MAIAAILGSSFFAGRASIGVQNNFQKIQQEFQALGEDLQSGNLAQARSDFATLTQYLPGQRQSPASGTQVPTQTTNPVSQTISQLGQDLKAGNLSAAQSDFATLRQDLQQLGGISTQRRHHHHGLSPSSGEPSGPATLFGDLSQELQSGNLAAAQQTYSALQQDFLRFTKTGTTGPGDLSGPSSTTPSLNVSA